MKKTAVFILLVCYFVVSSGVVVNFHYCMDKLASMELFAFKGERCGKCGMNIHKSHGCCRDEVKVVKMEEDQKIKSAIFFGLQSPDVLYHIPSSFIATSFFNVVQQRHFQNHSPPLLAAQDFCVENCVFRI